MNWFQIAMLIVTLLKSLRKSVSLEGFASSSFVTRFGFDGALLRWAWENREEVIEFVLRLMSQFSQAQLSALFEKLRDAESQEAFATAAEPYAADGRILKFLWENRDEILSWVLRLIEEYRKPNVFGSNAGESLALDLIEA